MEKACCKNCINNQEIYSYKNRETYYCKEHSFLVPNADSICCDEYVSTLSKNKNVTYYYDVDKRKLVLNNSPSILHNDWLGGK